MLHVYPDDKCWPVIQSGDDDRRVWCLHRLLRSSGLGGGLDTGRVKKPAGQNAILPYGGIGCVGAFSRQAMSSSGVPRLLLSPPSSPPSEPRSIFTQSAGSDDFGVVFGITTGSRPWSIRRSKTARSFVMSSPKRRPVVGSSQMKSKPSLVACAKWAARLTRWASLSGERCRGLA